MSISIKDKLDIELDLLEEQYDKKSNDIDVQLQLYYLLEHLPLLKISLKELIKIADAIGHTYKEENIKKCYFCENKDEVFKPKCKLMDIESYMSMLVSVIVTTIERMVEEKPKLSMFTKHDDIWNKLIGGGDYSNYSNSYGAMQWSVNINTLDYDFGIKISLPALRKEIKSYLPKKVNTKKEKYGR